MTRACEWKDLLRWGRNGLVGTAFLYGLYLWNRYGGRLLW